MRRRAGRKAVQGHSRLVLSVRLYRARTMLGHRDTDEVVREAESVADQARRAGTLPWCVAALAVVLLAITMAVSWLMFRLRRKRA